MLQEFKDFINRGNLIDLAIAVVLATFFAPVITAIVDGVILNLIGAIFGQPNLDRIWTITINDSQILPGVVLTALLNFLLVALAIYVVVVAPLNRLAERRAAAAAAEETAKAPAPAEDVVLLTEIRDLLSSRK